MKETFLGVDVSKKPHTNKAYSQHKTKRWRIRGRDDLAVLRNTKSEAIAWIKNTLGVDKITQGLIIEHF